MGICSDPPEHLEKNYIFKVEEEENLPRQDMPKKRLEFKLKLDDSQKGHKYQIFSNLLDTTTSPYISEIVLYENKPKKSQSGPGPIPNPDTDLVVFKKFLICDYFKEKKQILDIDLQKDSIPLGHTEITLANIVNSPSYSYKIADGVTIIVSAQPIVFSNSTVEFDFKVENLNNVDFHDPENYFSYSIINNEKEEEIYASESISFKGKFNKARIPAALLQNGFTIRFINSKQEILGEKNDNTLADFTKPDKNFYLDLKNPKGKLFYIYNRSKKINNYSLDYLGNKYRVTIKLIIGIDYSLSNKDPNDPLSLHYLGGESDYEKAINACGNIVAKYTKNERFSVYGFGARIKGQNAINHCFNINFKNNPEIEKIDGVIREYRNSFNNLKLDEPTFFSPLINKVIENINKEFESKPYHILLILTVGVIDDVRNTIDALVEASSLPLSVIIIGIGNENFQAMKELDGDFKPLISSNGSKSKRDLVKFIRFNEYKYTPNKLEEQVLEKINRQASEYYTI